MNKVKSAQKTSKIIGKVARGLILKPGTSRRKKNEDEGSEGSGAGLMGCLMPMAVRPPFGG